MVVIDGRGFEEGRGLFDDVFGYIEVRGHIEGGIGLFSEHGQHRLCFFELKIDYIILFVDVAPESAFANPLPQLSLL